MREEIVTIKGMHCKSCVDLIESKINSLEGVESIKVDLIKNSASVRFDPGQISLDEIKNKINALGYSTSPETKGSKRKTILQGIAYGLIPHTGCIAFIIGSILGVTFLMEFFKPLLMNPYFFHILTFIAFGFATLSSAIYLRKNGFFSLAGVKRKWKYLSVMYGSTIGINLVLFMVVFPLLANTSASQITGAYALEGTSLSSIKLSVNIPCPGHAPLISEELKTIDGVAGVQFGYPNNFNVKYDSAKTSKQEILSLAVFDTYSATVLNESAQQNNQQIQPQIAAGTCGGSCGGCGCGCGGLG